MLLSPAVPTKVHFMAGEEATSAARPACVCAVPSVLSASECAMLIDAAETAASVAEGWHDRGATLPTDDVPVSSLCPTCRSLVRERMTHLMRIAKSELLHAGSGTLYVKEVFVIKYGGQGDCRVRRSKALSDQAPSTPHVCRDALARHTDDTAVTINISLAEAGRDYGGGGTQFYACQGDVFTIRPRAGSAILHDGYIEHAGAPVSGGLRYQLVAFCHLKELPDEPSPSCQIVPGMSTVIGAARLGWSARRQSSMHAQYVPDRASYAKKRCEKWVMGLLSDRGCERAARGR